MLSSVLAEWTEVSIDNSKRISTESSNDMLLPVCGLDSQFAGQTSFLGYLCFLFIGEWDFSVSGQSLSHVPFLSGTGPDRLFKNIFFWPVNPGVVCCRVGWGLS